MTKKTDLKYGKTKEDKVLIRVKNTDKYKNAKSTKTEFTKYCPMDLICKDQKTFFEIKSRTNKWETYDTTIIGQDKIDWVKTNYPTYKIILIFNFTDVLTYQIYRENRFNKYLRQDFVRDYRGCYDKKKPYVFIPIKDLKVLHRW